MNQKYLFYEQVKRIMFANGDLYQHLDGSAVRMMHSQVQLLVDEIFSYRNIKNLLRRQNMNRHNFFDLPSSAAESNGEGEEDESDQELRDLMNWKNQAPISFPKFSQKQRQVFQEYFSTIFQEYSQNFFEFKKNQSESIRQYRQSFREEGENDGAENNKGEEEDDEDEDDIESLVSDENDPSENSSELMQEQEEGPEQA